MSSVYHTPSLCWALAGPGVSGEQNSCHHHETQSVGRKASLNQVVSEASYEAVLFYYLWARTCYFSSPINHRLTHMVLLCDLCVVCTLRVD